MTLNDINQEDAFLSSYDENEYKRPSVTSDMIIFTTADQVQGNQRKVPQKGLQVILVQRNQQPSLGKWALPGGFVDVNESLEASVKRKLKEKIGIENIYTEQLYTFGDLERDQRTRVISIAHLALVEKCSIQLNNEGVLSLSQWFWVNKELIHLQKEEKVIVKTYRLSLKSTDDMVNIEYEIIEKTSRDILRSTEMEYRLLEHSTEALAFDHYKILDYAIMRLRNKVAYTSIAFNLLPIVFTVKELQNVYEAILGNEILNFRRKMEDMIVETDEIIEGKPFRPAKVFKFNENWEHNF